MKMKLIISNIGQTN